MTLNPRAVDHPPPTIDVPDRPRDIREDFVESRFPLEGDLAGIGHPVFTKGDRARPAVLVLHELTGLTWQCARLARLVEEAGFRVYVPLFFGRPNASGNGGLFNVVRQCLNQEFKFLQANVDRPITRWLAALAKQARAECGGRGVGVVGMCLTGAFGLTLLLETDLNAVPVVCQPSIPLTNHSNSGLRDAQIPEVAQCARERALPIRALGFADDGKGPAKRLAELERQIPTMLRWPLSGKAHSTLTSELATGRETAAALEDTLEYLRTQLL
jgi:dienelactone hydrolase